jgi:3-isopropylmalate dehydratase small subunit
MEKFDTREGVAAPVKINVDTDMIVPKQHLKTIKRIGPRKVRFEIDPFRKDCLLNSLHDIGLTRENNSSIDAREAKLNEHARA